jgi:AraC-like DNA-binding protein
LGEFSTITTDFIGLPRLNPDASLVQSSFFATPDKHAVRYSGGGRPDSLICLQGEGERLYHVAGMEPFVLHENELIFIPITSRYVSVSDSPPTGWYSVNFNLYCGAEQVYIGEPFRIIKNGLDYLPLIEAVRHNIHSPLRSKAALLNLLAALCENLRAETYREDGFSSIYECVARMEQHPERSFSVEHAAKKCFLSDTSFRAKFKQITGFTPTEYRNHLRIERADAMLRTENFTLDAIAEMLGFWDSAHFCRVYKQLRGHTPGGR